MTRQELEALKSITTYLRQQRAYDPGSKLDEEITTVEKLVKRTIEENKIIERNRP